MNSPCHWIEFNIFVLIAVALDLVCFTGGRTRSHLEALLWSGIWIGAARCLQPACITLRRATGTGIFHWIPDREIVERGQSVPVSGFVPHVWSAGGISASRAGLGNLGRADHARLADCRGRGAG